MLIESAMQLALDEASLALSHGDVPVGAVVLLDGEVIAQRHNERQKTQDPTAHAEVLALRDAAAAIGNWHLNETTLVVTLEPCFMCAGACVSSRLGHLVYGATDPKAGAVESLATVCSDSRLNHRVLIESGLMAAECGQVLKDFFAAARQRKLSGLPMQPGHGNRSSTRG